MLAKLVTPLLKLMFIEGVWFMSSGANVNVIKLQRHCKWYGRKLESVSLGGGDCEEDDIMGRGFVREKERFPMQEISGVIRFVLRRI
jgi:hypothetical protein